MTPIQPIEKRLVQAGRDFAYPPTPDITQAVAEKLNADAHRGHLRPRLVWATALASVLLISGLMAVPTTRAAIAEWIQVGAVRIWLVDPTLTRLPPTETPSATTVWPAATPIPTAIPLASVLDLWGKQTLAEAQTQVDFPIRLPTYPPDLGEPDHVFLQRTNGFFVVLVWTNADEPTQIRQVLYQIGPGVGIAKGGPLVLRETVVHGRPASWVAGQHLLFDRDRHFGQVRSIGQDVLLWTEMVNEQEITYRLETGLSEEKTIQIAESLRAVEP